MSTYLRGRKAACVYKGFRSKFRTVHIGVFQGSVLSPALFNYFTSDFPDVSGYKSSFADDFTIRKSDPDPEVIASALNRDLVLVSKCSKRKQLTISAKKFQVAFFTPWSRENTFPPIFYEGKPIPVTQAIKILGLTFYWLHTFTPHVNEAKSKGCSRIPIIKAVMGPNWSFTMEDGILTYKALIMPVFGHGAAAWHPTRSSLKHPVDASIKCKTLAFVQSRAAIWQPPSNTFMMSAGCCRFVSSKTCRAASSC
jgi:hypothetical protein